MKRLSKIERPIQSNSISNLMERISMLERKVEQLENINLEVDAYGNKILKQGVEHISKILSGSIVSEYSWQNANWIKYNIQLEGVTGDWEVNMRKDCKQLTVGAILRHYVIGRKITSFKIISNE